MGLGFLLAILAAVAAMGRADGCAREAVTFQKSPGSTSNTVVVLCPIRHKPQGPLAGLQPCHTSQSFLGRSKFVSCPSSKGRCNAVLPTWMRCCEPALPGAKLLSLEVTVYFETKPILCCKSIVTLSKRSSNVSEWTSLVISLT